jgi:hypothetical protein
LVYREYRVLSLISLFVSGSSLFSSLLLKISKYQIIKSNKK